MEVGLFLLSPLALVPAPRTPFAARPLQGAGRLHAAGRLSDPPRMGYLETAVGVLASTPLGGLSDSPLFQPLAAGLAIGAPAAVAAVLLKFAVESLLVQLLGLLPPGDGNRYSPGTKLGSGSFGAVYEGFQAGERSMGSDSAPSVVIKSIGESSNKIFGEGASSAEFGRSELFINQKLMLCGQSSCIANFKGHYFNGRFLNLLYDFEGTLTLDGAMKARDFPFNLEEAVLGKRGGDASFALRVTLIRRITSQLFSNLAGIHFWNIVHRDVKGSNLILAEKQRRFKLIDFGAAIDLISGTNYDPDVQVFDPSYCPPEAPPDNGGLQLSAKGKFDVYSAALVVMQMCFPAYRGANIKRFQGALAKADYDLQAWRDEAAGFPGFEEGFQILDESGGFQLLQGCLQYDPSDRITSAAAASSRFCRV